MECFDRLAVILHHGALARGGGDLVDQREIGDCLAEGSREVLARETEAVGLAIVRGAQNYESAIGIGGRERGVGGPIGFQRLRRG